MKRQNFNHHWTYHKEGDSQAVKVTLPHDAMIHDLRDPQSPGTHANAFFVGGIYVYEKTFSVPEDWKDKHVLFEFGGVYKNAEVYLNGRKAGERPYGYVPFTVCGDGFLNYGEENTIRVTADNSKLPNSRWYSGGGIYRPVSLIVGEKSYIEWEGVKISTISYDPAKIQVQTAVHLEANGEEEEACVQVEILDEQGAAVACGQGRDVTLDIPDARLWSDEEPNLYQYRVTLSRGEEILDEARGSFGIRKVEWSREGFLINGKQTLLRGACIHHDNGVVGACSYAESEERRVRILKENGYNAIRMAHHPASRLLLEACDRYGMYVMDETFDMWYLHKNKYDYALDFSQWYKEDIKAMVDQDFNHPSVVMYSIGNEVSEPYQPEGMEKAQEMIDLLHNLDPNRAVTGGINLMILYMASKGKGLYKEEGGLVADDKASKKKKGDKQASGSLFYNMMVSVMGTGMNKQANSDKADQVTSPVLDALDIAGYNYASGRYPLEGRKHPGRIVVGSETFPQDIAKNWKMVKKYPYLIGDFMWTGWDYLGEAAIGAWNYEGVTMQNVPYPWLLADVGAIDITGYAGAPAKYAATVWGLRKQPYIGVRPVNHPGKRVSKAVWRGTNASDSWAWKNCDGNKAEVEIYADADYVKLYVNGKGVGKKKIKDYKAMYTLKYVPGTLTVLAFDADGTELGRSSLKSARGKLHLSVDPENSKAAAGSIVYVDVTLQGRNGVVESNDDRTLTVTVENGTLLGFGSARPNTAERFDQGTYTTYYGRALAVVRAGAAGTLTVRVSGGDLTGQAEIEVVEK